MRVEIDINRVRHDMEEVNVCTNLLIVKRFDIILVVIKMGLICTVRDWFD